MNVLVILSTPDTGTEAVQSWHQRLTPDDRLYLMSIDAAKEQKICGVDVHYLEVDGNRGICWRPRLTRGVGRRLVSYGAGLWSAYLADIWPEFIWNIRCFDPDIIDLRWAQGKDLLKRKLQNAHWRVICSDENVPLRETADASWRSYDPDQKVSIVLPVYNGEAYLRQSIESCLEQTHRKLELVIVDDCSTDGSPSIIAEYASRDPRIISIRNPRNKRLPGALNVGFAATTGELLTWTSHDNYYAPTAVEALVRYLCTWQDIDLVYSAYRIVDATWRTQPEVHYLRPPWRLPFQNVVGAYFLYRRAVYEQVGNYREDMEYVEDYEHWVRVYKKGFKIMRLHDPLYYYRHHSDSMTAQADKMADKPHVGDKVRREHFEPVPVSSHSLIRELSDPFDGNDYTPKIVWPKIRAFMGRQKRRMFPQLGTSPTPRPILNFSNGSTAKLRKRALLIYLTDAFYKDPQALRKTGFITPVQSLEIARALNRLGYVVDVVDYRDDKFVPSKHYDVCFGMHYNFGRLLPLLSERKTLNIYYATGAYWEAENAAEDARCKSLKLRRGVELQLPTRLTFNNWVQAADAVIAQGNEYVLGPYRLHNARVFGIDHATFLLEPPDFNRKDFARSARQNFLWFGSIGLLHKGLDVVLEAFSELKDLHLWVCGPLQFEDEKEFIRAYRNELFHTPNIHPIGWTNVHSRKFRELTNKCVATVHASCADSMPGGILNCMARGLIPLVSRESGMDTDGFGVTLEESSVPEIRRVVSDIVNTPPDVCRSMAEEAYKEACTRYTLESFCNQMEEILETVLNGALANNTDPVTSCRDVLDLQPRSAAQATNPWRSFI